MKYKIIEDEWYPVYSFTDSNWGNTEVDIDQTTYKRMVKVFKAFDKVQDELALLVDKTDNDAPPQSNGDK